MQAMQLVDFTGLPPIRIWCRRSPVDDEELMLAAKGGSRQAFETLTKRYYPLIVGYCRRHHAHGAEDLAQDTFIRLWNTRANYQSQASFRAYLYVMATNLCRDAHRAEARRPVAAPEAAEALLQKTDPTKPAPERIELQQSVAQVQAALAKLPEAQREVLVLRWSEGLDYPEIARILGRGESTLRSQAFYGLKALRQFLVSP